MNKEKVYIEGYEIDTKVSSLGYREKKIQLMNGEIVIIDENFTHKSITPKKVQVKQFVADWYEENKNSFEFNVWDWIAFRDEAKKIENREFNNWINDSRENPIQTLVNMHQFGYEVEEEKRYYVRFKWIEDSYSYLTLIKHLHAWTLSNIKLDKKFRIAHTRKELEEAGFGWVFDCPGIEIEEVE